MGTVFGVILIPGLYFIFGHLARFVPAKLWSAIAPLA